MKKITISKVVITKFRNLKDMTINTPNKVTLISGGNHLGKTNCLHAIMWCLCGVDLYNSTDNSRNVPNFDKTAETDYLVDVTVSINGHDIRRTLRFEKKSLVEEIHIDGLTTETLKAGEIAIDDILGILKLTINCPKGVNVRRLLLNPLYINYIKESDLRSLIISLFQLTPDAQTKIFETLDKNTQKILKKELVDGMIDFTTVSLKLTAEIKKAKKDVELWKNAKSFIALEETKKSIDKEHILSLDDLISINLNKANISLLELQQKQVALDTLGLELSKHYDSVTQSTLSVPIKLIEKGVGEDVWKECCKPMFEENRFEFANGSTSQRIILAVKLLDALYLNYKLPILLDECETFDLKSTAELVKISSRQIIGSVVANSDTIQVNGGDK